MSMFENDHYRWRETYFVLFDSAKRPQLKAVLKRLSALGSHLTLANPVADDEGRFESITVLSPDDFAALDICYCCGEEVREQVRELAEELRTPECRGDELANVKRLEQCDGRFDLLHFEQLMEACDESELDEMFDPSSLLIVLEALADLTGGVAIDPQSGALM